MTARWLEEAVAVFGSTAPPRFPRNMAAEILLRLRVTVVPLPRPTPESMRSWLLQRGWRCRAMDLPRGVHGCMVWEAGFGVLFHDSEEDEAEQRFTLAHEAAHFVLDHLLPRQRAERILGSEILPVLDGERAPTPKESMTALFERVSLDAQSNLIHRDASGFYPNGRVAESERRADRLAQELLAPAALVMPLVLDVSEEEGVERVRFRFGLPGTVASAYVAMLRRRLRVPRFSSQQFLGVDGG